MTWNPGVKTFIAGEALAAYRRVKISPGTVTDPPEVVYAAAGEDFIGVTQYAVEIGADVAVKMNNGPGTFEIECAVSAAIARGTVLYGAASGKVSDASSGSAQGIALEAGVDGAVIEVAAWNVKSTTAGTVSIADVGNFTAAATVEAALAEIFQGLKTIQKTVPIPLNAITMEDGTALTKQATTVAGIAQLANKEQVIMIPVNCTVGEALGFSIPLPQDIDVAADIEIHVLAGKAADLDVLTLDCEVFPVAAGDVANADIQDTAAQTIVAAVTELIFICGLDGLLASPSAITGILTLGGTNDGDAVYIYAGWVEYKSKVLTS
jgi:hypothetical protein